jgi:ElaB/YqjD/DUF883 family membrane-anchored ribosome-binding protein
MDEQVRGGGQAWGSGAVRVLDYPTERSATEEIQTLMAAVEALLPRIDAAADSEVGLLRSEARRALTAARIALASPATQDRPNSSGRAWATAGLTALLAFSAGLWAGRAVTERW